MGHDGLRRTRAVTPQRGDSLHLAFDPASGAEIKLDWAARKARRIETAPDYLVHQVLQCMAAVIEP